MHPTTYFGVRRGGQDTLLPLPPPANAATVSTRRLRRILVATDGAAESRGALHVANLLARRDAATVHVLSALERWGAPEPTHDARLVTAELMAHRLVRVLPEARSALGGTRRWTIEVVDGGLATIGEVAEAHGYDLVVVGLRRQWTARWLVPTALRTARRTRVPVLAVPPSVTRLPRRAVIGLDGGEAALAAARAAARLLEVPARVHLAHVVAARAPYHIGASPLLENAARAFESLRPARIERRILPGDDPGATLLSFAERVNADLVVVGSQTPTSLRTRLTGSVSRRILRGAGCAVLLAGQTAGGPPTRDGSTTKRDVTE